MPTAVTQKSFVRGVVATAGVMSQPRGSVPRASNLLLTRRGSLRTCDGSGLIHAFQGAVQANRGKMLAAFLFAPIGVPNYYLALAQALDQPLGAPLNLTVVNSGGGHLSNITYFYVVTALDGVGGETIASAEVSILAAANSKNTLTWNVVPNAAAYNVYVGLSSGNELLLAGTGLPVPQPAYGALMVSFVDTGFFTFVTLNLASSYYTSPAAPATGRYWRFQTATAHNLNVGSRYLIAGVTPASPFNGPLTVTGVIDAFTVESQNNSVGTGQTLNGSGGTMAVQGPPLADTTQQIALYKMPLILGVPAQLPVSYSNANIVALFPAGTLSPTVSSVTGGGGAGPGGGGNTGGVGTGGGGKGPHPVV